ncbi:hypothetical protein IKQ26_04500 [bacterium]|nr:hypothetical protein [bacterium]
MRKKFLIFGLVLLSLTLPAYSHEIEGDKPEIAFIYLNGANNNTPKMKKWFYDGIAKFHPILRKTALNSEFIEKFLLENSKYTISYAPEIFFWGDKSSHEIRALKQDLMYTKTSSPFLAQLVRSVFTSCMHDAIWVQKDHNMHDIVEDLHKVIIDDYNNNRPVVLFGYSAGTFITYEYLCNKLPNIDTLDLFSKIEVHPELIDFISKHKMNDTCIDALINSKLTVFSNLGHLVPRQDMENFKKNYLELDEYTCKYCMPKGAVKGIVNYASPLPLFYSDITNPNYVVTYYVRLLYKYIVENNMFWITVNYADDPLGYPTTRNLTPSEYEQTLNVSLKHDRYGFIYDKSNIKSPKTFLGAHTSYWSTSKKFAQAIVNGYEEGYVYFNYYDKVIEEENKNNNLLSSLLRN